MFLITPDINEIDLLADKSIYNKQSYKNVPDVIWNKYSHPYINIYFYGKINKRGYIIPVDEFKKAIDYIKDIYITEYIIHIPINVYVDKDKLYEYVLSNNYKKNICEPNNEHCFILDVKNNLYYKIPIVEENTLKDEIVYPCVKFEQNINQKYINMLKKKSC